MSYYIVPDDLRTELGLSTVELPDLTADDVIESAEDLIDQGIANRPVHDDVTASSPAGAGRKIDLLDPDVQDWQIAKLQRATVKLAAQLYREPQVRGGEQYYSSISGPEFSFGGLVGSRINRDTMTALNASGLRRLGGRARPTVHPQEQTPFFVD